MSFRSIRSIEKRISALEAKTGMDVPVFMFSIGGMDRELQEEIEELEQSGREVVVFTFEEVR